MHTFPELIPEPIHEAKVTFALAEGNTDAKERKTDVFRIRGKHPPRHEEAKGLVEEVLRLDDEEDILPEFGGMPKPREKAGNLAILCRRELVEGLRTLIEDNKRTEERPARATRRARLERVWIRFPVYERDMRPRLFLRDFQPRGQARNIERYICRYVSIWPILPKNVYHAVDRRQGFPRAEGTRHAPTHGRFFNRDFHLCTRRNNAERLRDHAEKPPNALDDFRREPAEKAEYNEKRYCAPEKDKSPPNKQEPIGDRGEVYIEVYILLNA